MFAFGFSFPMGREFVGYHGRGRRWNRTHGVDEGSLARSVDVCYLKTLSTEWRRRPA